jgi:hypothetical protein
MSLRIIGAGMGRTGTHSLKVALERLLGGPCYHMLEAFEHPEHVDLWRAAFQGDPSGLPEIMDGYVATVDWPGGACWRELRDLWPEAPVLLSTRDSSEVWWRSANATMFEGMRRTPDPDAPLAVRSGMILEMNRYRFTAGWDVKDEAIRCYEAFNEAVRSEVPSNLLVEWRPGDGWEPLAAALGVECPAEEFPHLNSTKDFRDRYGYE